MNPSFGVSAKNYIYGPTSVFFIGKYSIFFRILLILFVTAVLLFSAFLTFKKPHIQTKYYFIRLSTGFLLTRLMDVFITFINTPNLTKEGNILVTRFGLGWKTLLFNQILIFFFILLCTYCFCHYERKTLSAKSFSDYIMQWLDLDPRHSVLPLVSYTSYWSITVMSLSPIPVLNWMLYMLTKRAWWNDYSLIPLICCPTAIWCACKFLHTEYMENCNHSSTLPKDK